MLRKLTFEEKWDALIRHIFLRSKIPYDMAQEISHDNAKDAFDKGKNTGAVLFAKQLLAIVNELNEFRKETLN